MRSSLTSLAIIGLLLSAALAGCHSDKKTYAENARLRSEAIQLKDQVQSLQRRNDELAVQLQQAAKDPHDVPAEILAVMPVVTEIAIGRLSHVRDADSNGQPDSLVIYVHPADGLGRFTQLIGTLSATAMLVQSGDQPPMTIGQASLTPMQVREAYRASIAGIHYTVEIPIEPAGLVQNREPAPSHVVVLVSYEDGTTGRQLTAERTIELKVAQRAQAAPSGDEG